MTESLFHFDSYKKECDAVVMAVRPDDSEVLLDRTVFFTGGGGQPCDTGSLLVDGRSSKIIKVRRKGDDIWHRIDGTLPAEGDSVTAVLDWDRRYALMRTHSALHVLCGVIWRDYSASVTGCNMEPLKARMDFEFETMSGELVAEIEKNVNIEIGKERDVKVAVLPREEAFKIPDLIRTKINLLPESITEVRTIEIDGLDIQADGGTHVNNIREVGAVRVTNYHSKGRINKRITIEVE